MWSLCSLNGLTYPILINTKHWCDSIRWSLHSYHLFLRNAVCRWVFIWLNHLRSRHAQRRMFFHYWNVSLVKNLWNVKHRRMSQRARCKTIAALNLLVSEVRRAFWLCPPLTLLYRAFQVTDFTRKLILHYCQFIYFTRHVFLHFFQQGDFFF